MLRLAALPVRATAWGALSLALELAFEPALELAFGQGLGCSTSVWSTGVDARAGRLAAGAARKLATGADRELRPAAVAGARLLGAWPEPASAAFALLTPVRVRNGVGVSELALRGAVLSADLLTALAGADLLTALAGADLLTALAGADLPTALVAELDLIAARGLAGVTVPTEPSGRVLIRLVDVAARDLRGDSLTGCH